VKEELIREFQQELKNKDDEYVKALKKQARRAAPPCKPFGHPIACTSGHTGARSASAA